MFTYCVRLITLLGCISGEVVVVTGGGGGGDMGGMQVLRFELTPP